MTHRQYDSCFLRALVPSREKNISCKDARTQRDQRKPCSSKKTIQGYAAPSNTHVPMTHNQRDSCSLCGFAPSREKKHLTQRRQDAKRPKEATLQQKTIQGYAALSNTHVPMTHNQCDSCSLCGFAPSRKKKTSHAKTPRRKETKGSHAPAKKQFRGMQPRATPTFP